MGSGLHVGRVTRLVGALVFVAVNDHAPGREFGPLEGLVDQPLDVGDRVLVGLLGGRRDDVVIVRKM